MAASATALEYVQKMYIAYFGRPVAPTGQEYYGSLVDAGNVAALQDDFWNSTESQGLFNQATTEGKVNAIFNQLFGRDAAVAGLTYWTGEINSGRVSLPAAALTILNSAADADLTAFNAKLAVAEAFTAELDTTAEILAYQSNTDGGRSTLTGVTTTAEADAAVAAIATTVASVVAGGNTNEGQTFTLTNSTDNLTGTSGNDTFIGDNVSTSAGDTLAGGAGTDTLKIFGTNTIPNFSGVESVYYNAAGGAVNLSTKSEVTSIEMDTFGTNTLTVGSGQAVKLTNQVGTATIAGNSPTTLSLTLDKAGTATTDAEVALTGTALTTLDVTASGNASYVTVTNAGAKLATVNIAGDKNVALQHALTTVTTINAGSATGNVTIDGVGASNLTFTGGSGNDKIVMANTVTAADVLKGGTGTDTLSVSDADTIDTAAEVIGITEFEVLEAAGTDATAYNLSVIGAKNTITGLVISATGGAVTASNLNAATAGNITINGDAPTTVTLTAADFVAGGTSDTATIKIDNSVVKSADGVDITSLVFANADVLNLQSLGDGSSTKVTGGAEENSVALTATDVEKVVITGDEALAFSTAAGTLPTEIDASGMTNSAAVTIDTDASAIVSLLVKGSSKNDTIDTDNAATLTNTLYTGGGSDTVVIQGASNAASSMIFTATALNSGDLKAGDATTVTLTGASAGATVTINLTSALEGLLKSGSTLLSATAGNINIHGTTLSATTNVAAAQAGNNMVLQFDLNGDGAYTATDDAQITIVGTGTDDTLVYNAAGDFFLFTVV